MSESFGIGEVVEVIAGPGEDMKALRLGDVSVIDGPFKDDDFWSGVRYGVRYPDGEEADICMMSLRKRRPPDWVKLCNLTDVPCEVAHG